MNTPEVIELLKKADTAIHEQYHPHDTDQTVTALAIEKIKELEKQTVSSHNELENTSKLLEVAGKRIIKLEEQLNDSANTIDELVKSGHISHHPQVELDALTDSMRSVTNK